MHGSHRVLPDIEKTRAAVSASSVGPYFEIEGLRLTWIMYAVDGFQAVVEHQYYNGW